MARKFSLHHKKRQHRTSLIKMPHKLTFSISERRKTTFPVSIPLHLVQAPKFVISLPLSIYLAAPITDLEHLHKRLSAQSLPVGWVEHVGAQTSSALVFARLSISSPLLSATATFLVKVHDDLSWTLSCHGVKLEVEQCQFLATFPQQITSVSDMMSIFSMIDASHVCCGNPVDEFKELVDVHRGEFRDASGSRTVASIDSQSATIRHAACELLLPGNGKSIQCKQCKKFRANLRVARIRLQKRVTAKRTYPSSSVPYSALSKDELQTRMASLHSELRRILKQQDRMKQRLAAVIKMQGIAVDEQTHSDLKQIIKTEVNKLMESAPSNSFQRVFWQQQIDAASKEDARGMRWHPLMIRWCIYLRHQSQGAYETLRQSKCVSLPSQRTLRDYTHHIKPTIGFSAEVDSQLYHAAKLDRCEEREKYVILLLDEMHIKENLVFDKHSGELIGFMNLGEINSHLLALEHSLSESDSTEPPLANSVMTFMVRGLFSHLQFAYAYFPGNSISGDLLYNPFWEAVYRVERCGFKVMGATFDGASINRRLVRLHNPKRTLLHKVPNPYATDSREFFFFSDPPHLIKTTRNGWASKCRTLWKNGKEISWCHLRELYMQNRSETGLVLIPKLKLEHIELTSFSKMRVDLAAQVLSDSVSKALSLLGGPEATETAVFTGIFDKFFDALNTSNFTEGKNKRKPFKDPYRSGTDFRLKWLEETFLPYLDEWETSVNAREGKLTKAQRNLMLLSPETRDGLRMTTRSFVELVRYLFKVPGVNVFFSRRLCQDPIEKFFGCQRQIGGTHDNPTVKEFQQNTQALRVVNSFCREITKGNCRGNTEDAGSTLEQENYPLPRRSQCRAKVKSSK